MSKAIVVSELGGPEVLELRDHDVGRPGPGQILVAQKASGVNFIDVYFRTGVYKTDRMPFVPGKEGAGVVEEIGEGVSDVMPGDRVAYNNASGSYAEKLVIEAEKVLKLPDDISEETAAAAMLKGMTAQYLLRQTFRVGPDTVLLFHAAAGGVGLIAGQWAKHLGATVIGTAGSEEKCALARDHGYDHVINYREENFVDRVMELTEGRKCDVVYDSVGKDTFPASLDCLRPRGMWVTFGQSSGNLPPVDLAILNRKGSLFTTRPSLFGYTRTREELQACASDLFGVLSSGAVRVHINERYPLSEARKAHEDLEARRTTGASILTI